MELVEAVGEALSRAVCMTLVAHVQRLVAEMDAWEGCMTARQWGVCQRRS